MQVQAKGNAINETDRDTSESLPRGFTQNSNAPAMNVATHHGTCACSWYTESKSASRGIRRETAYWTVQCSEVPRPAVRCVNTSPHINPRAAPPNSHT